MVLLVLGYCFSSAGGEGERGGGRVESGEWRVESGEWRVESGEWVLGTGYSLFLSLKGLFRFLISPSHLTF